jgi:hypothetical protein
MKYNPLTHELFTDNDKLLKKLHCPLAQHWGLMTETTLTNKICGRCSKVVNDTSYLNEDEIMLLINSDPHTCFKVDLNQNNLTITYTNHG